MADDEPKTKPPRPTTRNGGAKAKAEADVEAGAPESEPSVTEKPAMMGPPPRTTEYVVTVDNRSGIPVKIEKLDEKTAARTELSEAEYAAMMLGGRPRTAAFGSAAPGPFLATAPPPAAPVNQALVDAYYRGVADYIKAIAGNF